MPTACFDVPVTEPFHADDLLDFLRPRAIPGVETVCGTIYSRSLRLAGGPAVIEANLTARGQLSVTATDADDIDEAVNGYRRFIDADADPIAIDRHLSTDPLLAPMVAAAPGIRAPGAHDGTEVLLRAIVGQQVSVAAARTELARLTMTVDDELPRYLQRNGITHLMPSPKQIAKLGQRPIGGMRRRAMTLAAAARDLAEGSLVIAGSTAELSARLTARAGIGTWTAGYVAMRALGDPDILLSTDLVLRHGASAAGLNPEQLAIRGTAWAPYRSYASMHLWRHAGNIPRQHQGRSATLKR